VRLLRALTGFVAAPAIASNRISFAFDLKGPSLTIDTACSSSLVGAHFASASLRTGETDMAVVGGVNIMASPVLNIALSRIGMLSPDGRCKAFDASGDGYGRGEGAGVVILKRLSDAVRDGDQVYCTLLGSSVNSDGRGSTPITAPNQAMQERMLRKAYKMAGVSPSAVQYMEAHGTGTLRGDPIEAGALGAVLGEGRPQHQPLAVGSVKTNIGHVEAGAGVAGLIKVCLCMKHGKVAPSLHFRNPNPLIDFDKLRMRVVTQLRDWPDTHGQPKLAGVNSFGFGGTNSHAVLQQPPLAVDRAAPWAPREEGEGVTSTSTSTSTSAPAPVFSLPLSAHTGEALTTMARQYAAALRTTPARVVDVCYTAAARRSRHKMRAVATGSTHEELAAALEAFAAASSSSTSSASSTSAASASASASASPPSVSSVVSGAASATEATVAFAFSGSGTAWPRMGQQLMQAYPSFAESIRRMDAMLARSPFSGLSLATELARPEVETRMKDLRVCQACIYAVQVALVELLGTWGVRPKAVVGHSIGEVAAAVTAGLMTVQDGLLLALRLGHFAHSVSGGGYMVTAPTSAAIALDAVGPDAHEAGVAAVNDDENVTLAGTTRAMDAVCARLAARGVTTTRVALGAPFHTVAVQQYQARYLAEFADLRRAAGVATGPGVAVHFYSTARPGASTATAEAAAGLSMDASYFWDNARRTVQFAPVVAAVTAEQGVKAWVEIGPTATLSVSLTALTRKSNSSSSSKSKAGAHVVPSMRVFNDRASFVAAAAALFVAGVEVTWQGVFDAQTRPVRMAELPMYPWNHATSYWMESRNHYCHRIGAGLPRPLLGIFHPLGVCDDSTVYEADISTETLPLLEDHVYQKSLLLPATMYMEICLALGRRLFGPDAPFSLHSLDLPQAMWFGADETREVRVTATRRRRGAAAADAAAAAAAGAGDGEGETKGSEAKEQQQRQRQQQQQQGGGDEEEDDEEYFVTVTSRRKKAGSDDAQGAVTQHSSCVLRLGRADAYTDVQPVEFAEITALQGRGEVIPHDQWYKNFQAVGFDFGPRFRNITQAWKAIPTAVGEIAVGPLIKEGMGEFVFHPGILDAAGQVLDATVSKESSIPVNIGRVTVHQRLDVAAMPKVLSYARMTRRTEDEASGKKFVLGDVFLFSPDGQLLLTLADFSCQVLDPTQSVAHVQTADDSVYHVQYQQASLPAAEATSVPGNSLVIVPRGVASISRANLNTLVSSLGGNETPQRCMTVEQDTRRVMTAQELQKLIVDSFTPQAAASNRRRRRRRAAGGGGGGGGAKGMPQLKRIVLVFHDPRGFDDAAPDAPARARVASHYLAATTLHVAQAVGNIFSRYMSSAPWVTFVTCGAVAPTGPASGLPSLLSAVQTSAHGYRRTLAHEFPSLRLRNFDIGAGTGTGTSADVAALIDELGSRPDDEEVAVRDGLRYVARYANVPRDAVSAERGATFKCRKDGTYVIIGGCRGLGLKLAGLLKQRGAGCLVLVSRSGVAPAAAAEVDQLAQGGCKVLVSKTDVTDEDAVRRMFDGLSEVPPVRGVVHSAMVLDDGLVLSQTSRRVERVLGPKVMGGLLLHRACRGLNLDFFCLFSSTTALFGNQGQFSYGGANAFLDGLAHLRARQGLPAVSVNWGAFKGIGYLARNTSVERQLQQRGWEGIDKDTFFDFFARFNASGLPQTSLALADLGKWFRHQPWAMSSPMYSAMAAKAKAAMESAAGGGNQAGQQQLLKKLQGAGDSDALPVIVAWTRGVIAMSLDVEAEEVDVDTSFPQLGVDSLMGMEVRNLVAEQLQVDMPLALMFGNTSVASLAEFLLQQVRQMAPVDADTDAAAAAADDAAAAAAAASTGTGTTGASETTAPPHQPSTTVAMSKVAHVPDTAPGLGAADAAKAAAAHLPYAPHAPSLVVHQAPVVVQAPSVPMQTSSASSTPVRVTTARPKPAQATQQQQQTMSSSLPRGVESASGRSFGGSSTAATTPSNSRVAPSLTSRVLPGSPMVTPSGPSRTIASTAAFSGSSGTSSSPAWATGHSSTPTPAAAAATHPAAARVVASSAGASPLSWAVQSPSAAVSPVVRGATARTFGGVPEPVVRPPPTTVPVDVLTSWLSRAMAVKNRSAPLPKFAYPSPGSLHPVQVYVVLPPRAGAGAGAGSGAQSGADTPSWVEGVPAGNYYYHPVEHRLYALRPPTQAGSAPALASSFAAACPGHASGATVCPFYAVLVGNTAAIEPLYGKAARPFLFFEAGAITRVLKEGGAEASMPLTTKPVATFTREVVSAFHDALALEEGTHLVLRSVYATL